MQMHHEIARRIDKSRRAWAVAIAEAASELGVPGETFLSTGDAYAIYAGRNSSLNASYGNYYPASLETIGAFYKGRASCWTAIPAQREQAVNSTFDVGGRAMAWEQVLCRSLSEERPTPSPHPLALYRTETLEPWIEATKNWFLPEDEEDMELAASRLRMTVAAPCVRCFLFEFEGDLVGYGAAFVNEATAFLLDVYTRYDGKEFDLPKTLLERLLIEIASDCDLAWIETDDNVLRPAAERAGFRVAYSQLAFTMTAL